ESAPTAEDADEHLTSPAVGVFYHAKEPGAEPFVSVGDAVSPGQQIGIVEAMKLMIPVEADRAGTIAAVVKDDGAPVEYGEPLFALAAAEGS
ncbi:acetyl-CoA carboxylase biotin carboxyl carrier protein subunit, partial [Actinomadura soli]